MIVLGDTLRRIWRVEDRNSRAGHGENTDHAHTAHILVQSPSPLGLAPVLPVTQQHATSRNRNLDAWRTDTGDPSSANILDHTLRINSSRVLEVTPNGLPTGAVTDVEASPFDFRTAMKIGARWDETTNLGGPGALHILSIMMVDKKR